MAEVNTFQDIKNASCRQLVISVHSFSWDVKWNHGETMAPNNKYHENINHEGKQKKMMYEKCERLNSTIDHSKKSTIFFPLANTLP